jgi:hypothetical protein
MPDIKQPFVAISGLAVGLTATTVITDTASLPVAVSSFNGFTGDITLTAGSGINLTNSANTITITTTGGGGGVDAAFVIAMATVL